MAKRLAPLLVLLCLSAAGCGGSHDSVAPAGLAQGGFVVRPAKLAERRCGDGHGVRIPARDLDAYSIFASTLSDGSTLIASSSARRVVVLHSITASCAPNPAFGRDGVATVAIPARLARPVPKYQPSAGHATLGIESLSPMRGGGAIVGGIYGANWVVGEITRRGRLNRGFGDEGWQVLPFHGEVTGALQERSGRIVLAGDNGGAGCCVVNWAAEVSANGTLERGFGRHGRAPLPTGEDSGVDRLAVEPNGDILADVGWGNSGCWGVTPAMLTPSGSRVPGFARRLRRFWRRLHLLAFAGQVYVTGGGFTLAGTGQKPCAGTPSLASAPSAAGFLARFRPDGTQIGRTVRFPSRMFNPVRTFADRRDSLIVESSYENAALLHVMATRPNGSIDERFASRGRGLIRLPWSSGAVLDVPVDAAGARELVVVAAGTHHRLELVRLRF